MAVCRATRGATLRRRVLFVVVAVLAAACTTLPAPPAAPLVRQHDGCPAWLSALDSAIAAAGVADAEAERIEGVAGLRVDRIGQALAEPARGDRAAWGAWLARAAALDHHARAAEIANLPPAAFALGSPAEPAASRDAARERTDRCRRALVRQLGADETSAALRGEVLNRAVVPDRYSTAGRAAGLYPLLRWPFFAGVQGWQSRHEADMRRWAVAPPSPRVIYRPGSALSNDDREPPAWPAQRDELGLPQLAAADEQRLLAWHAPVFELDEQGAFDRIGAPMWPRRDASAPHLDSTQPVVYARVTHTRFEGRWLLQLVYTVWFAERPARSSFDLLAGALDGVIVRLTLGEGDEPLLMDTIHACGCYHLFFPSAALRARAEVPRHEEWMFAPAPLPRGVGREARLVVRLASATHYVSGLAAQPRAASEAPAPSPEARRYTLRSEHALRSLPLPGGTERRSLYDPDGLVAGSERGERFLFWPMGIASAGAMRQWGHHATAFVGRRHFDEVDLIELRFVRAALPSPLEP